MLTRCPLSSHRKPKALLNGLNAWSHWMVCAGTMGERANPKTIRCLPVGVNPHKVWTILHATLKSNADHKYPFSMHLKHQAGKPLTLHWWALSILSRKSTGSQEQIDMVLCNWRGGFRIKNVEERRQNVGITPDLKIQSERIHIWKLLSLGEPHHGSIGSSSLLGLLSNPTWSALKGGA